MIEQSSWAHGLGEAISEKVFSKRKNQDGNEMYADLSFTYGTEVSTVVTQRKN